MLILKSLFASFALLFGSIGFTCPHQPAPDPEIFHSDSGLQVQSGSYVAHYASGAMPTVYYSAWQLSATAWQGVRDGDFDPDRFYGDFRWETDTGGVILMRFEGYWNDLGNPSISWSHETEQEIDFMNFMFTSPFLEFHNSLRETLTQYRTDHP